MRLQRGWNRDLERGKVKEQLKAVRGLKRVRGIGIRVFRFRGARG